MVKCRKIPKTERGYTEMKLAVEIGFFCLALIGFLGAVCMAIDMHKKKKTLGFVAPVHMLFGSVIAAGVLLYSPAYYWYLECNETCDGFFQAVKGFLMAVYSTVRLFMCDGDFSVVYDSCMSEAVVPYYVGFLSVLQVMAPAMTAVSVLSVLFNMSSWVQYQFSRKKDIFAIQVPSVFCTSGHIHHSVPSAPHDFPVLQSRRPVLRLSDQSL